MAAVKEQKTAQSSTKALKSHEKKVTEDLKRNLKQEKQVLRPARKPFWFEKFLFFISSEGYLVLGYVLRLSLSCYLYELTLAVAVTLCRASYYTVAISRKAIFSYMQTWKALDR
jgi:preprotein translocase subunit Sss1